ncbi:MAG: GNAT family N-acetyltransferase [Clostridium sp.]
MFKDIDFIERTILNSIPSKNTILLDNWLIRLNEGYTYRANCVCPFQYDNTLNLDNKIKYCEKIFTKNCLPTVFKVSPDLQEGLGTVLETKGYKKIKTVNAMICTLNADYSNIPKCITLKNSADSDWLNASAILTGIDKSLFDIHCRSIQNLAIESVFVQAVKDNKIIGCGYGTIEGDYVGIYDLHVDINYRKQGIGNGICDAILSYGREHGAYNGYLIVNSLNENAIKIYKNKGFAKAYEYYFYKKDCESYFIIDA